jgi:hypothetical protein
LMPTGNFTSLALSSIWIWHLDFLVVRHYGQQNSTPWFFISHSLMRHLMAPFHYFVSKSCQNIDVCFAFPVCIRLCTYF